MDKGSGSGSSMRVRGQGALFMADRGMDFFYTKVKKNFKGTPFPPSLPTSMSIGSWLTAHGSEKETERERERV
jgi:hypothetical protein